MSPALLLSFANPSRHVAVSDLIRQHSVNRADVREVVRAGLDLMDVQSVPDLIRIPLLIVDHTSDGQAPAARVAPMRQGQMALERNDAAFGCRKPRCQ